MKRLIILLALLTGCVRYIPEEETRHIPPTIEYTVWSDGKNTVMMGDKYAECQIDSLYHWNHFKVSYEYVSETGAVLFGILNSPMGNYKSMTLGLAARVDTDSTMTFQIVEETYDWKTSGIYKDKSVINNSYVLKRQ